MFSAIFGAVKDVLQAYAAATDWDTGRWCDSKQISRVMGHSRKKKGASFY